MHGALAAEQLGPGFIDEPDSNSVDPYFSTASAHPKDEVGPRMDRGEPTHPHMLKDSEDREFTLLVDQGVVSQNRKVDLQVRTPGSR